MKYNIMTAKEAKIKQAQLNSPDRIKTRNEIRLTQELDRLNGEIQDAIQRNESDVTFAICLCPEIVKPMNKILQDLGYTISKIKLGKTFIELKIKW